MRPLLFVLSLVLVGCPPGKREPSPGCKKVGETCEVSPGKLGTCVVRDDCRDTSGCMVCQPQH